MSRRFLVTLLFITLLVIIAINPSKVVFADFLPNGGFESFPSGGVNDWTWPDNNWVWDSSIAHSGTHSARVSRYSGVDTESLRSAYVAVQPSTEYTLTYWLRTDNATFYPRVVLYQYTSNGIQTGPYLVAYSNIENGTNDWKAVNYRFQTNSDAAQLRLRIYLYTDTTGTFWFDDFSLNDGTSAHFPYQSGFPVVATGWVWLSSPTVADINLDGNNELLIGAGNAVNGWSQTGESLPGFPLLTNDRSIVAHIALGNLDQDNQIEIVAGTRAQEAEGQCRVFAWNDNGALLSGWPQSVAWNTQYSNSNCWITSVVLEDIDGDFEPEILASTTNNGGGYPTLNVETPNLYAWHPSGTMVSGNWPNWQTTAGIYGALAVGDISGDGKGDVIVGRDYLYLNAYSSNGQSLPGWPIRTFVNRNDGDYDTEQRIEFSVNGPVIADLEGDGSMEVIATGHVSGPGNINQKLNSAVLVLHSDGTRKPGWETAALGNGILAQDDLPWQGPAVADLDDDGQLEIIVATHDGWIRAYKADKTLLWAFNYTQGATLFATDPVVGDIDGDGELETLFGTYVPLLTETNRDGPVGLWALKPDGSVVTGFPLVLPTPGTRSAPTLADLDRDGDLEILAATRTGQIVVWDTSTPYNPARLPWPTGRHDSSRSATYSPQLSLEASHKSVAPHFVKLGDTATFSIHLRSNTPVDDTISLTDTIPAGLSYVPGTLNATSGVATETGGVIHWGGDLNVTLSVEITYDVIVTTATPQIIHNTAIIDTVANGLLTRTASINANFFQVYLPRLIR